LRNLWHKIKEEGLEFEGKVHSLVFLEGWIDMKNVTFLCFYSLEFIFVRTQLSTKKSNLKPKELSFSH